jgi:hypothetical protein
MIAFGVSVTKPALYESFAKPGIRLAAEPDSELFAYNSIGSLFRSYNTILDQASGRDDIEALVLVHQDAEIVSHDFCAKVREALSDPEVALVGCGGAVGVDNIAWWAGSVTWASFTTHYEELGGGEVPGLTWLGVPSHARTGEVDTIDGFVIAMSPWAIRELRFDESLGALHGYDFDLCMQARDAGKKVVTTDFRVIHHHSLNLISDQEGWIAAHTRIADKWEGKVPDRRGEDWKRRARRAEAEAEIAQLHLQLAELLVTKLYTEHSAVLASKSMKLTAPFRWSTGLLRRLRQWARMFRWRRAVEAEDTSQDPRPGRPAVLDRESSV